ncbi:SAF domain-containing protein [Bifidobacterium platyrrhinorum]|uniref:SAF domain-containing protein n=1 Tax=Bifidobacterium platyrrhinorum TaxID=2661628 RepID=A0A6L9SV27_9BIFI|nr:SAF domain-containing protein [Bifidobacterium platyrrhinorum]NEG55011.1 hypothetical protein [Bifidobacterium platyrrhinorum]
MTRFRMPWARLTRPTLAAKRARARLMRLVMALCSGFAVVLVLTSLDAMTSKTTVVVASRDVERGNVIRDGDVRIVEAPYSPVVSGALSDRRDAVGRVAQTDLMAYQPLFPTNARDAPVVPSGMTVLEVRVANDASRLIPGDMVSLVSAVGCGAEVDGGNDTNGDKEDADGGNDAGHTGYAGTDVTAPAGTDGVRPCTLAEETLVMARAAADEGGSGAAVIPLAMPPDAALRVMASAELGAVVAVMR